MITTQEKKRYAAVGTGGRIRMFIDPLVRDYPGHGELVGLCDVSETRLNVHRNRLVEEYGCRDLPVFPASKFERMLGETRPDVVFVCTVDAFHHEYIIKAVEFGCEVVTEKPMTIDETKCRAILEAVERTGRKVRVALNYRWAPGASKVRESIASGVIGTVRSVAMEYMLNTSHGADYFRRWHSYKNLSGGLLVHKATHHFDLVNWWIDAVPRQVFSYGDLVFYGKDNAIARGDEALTRYPRYAGVPGDGNDPFHLDITKGNLKKLYYDAEKDSGYIRDENVFREGIDIEDSMSVLVKYRTGATLTYSLNAFCPVEGFRVSFNGDRGRIDYLEMHDSHIISGQSDRELAKEQAGEARCQELTITPHFQKSYRVEIPVAEGGHGGGDPLLQRRIFDPDAAPDPVKRDAGHEQGAASVLIGVAANHSMTSNQPVAILDLVSLKPDARHLHELV